MATTTDTSTTKLNPSSGVHVATREMSGATDTWHEELHATPCERGVLLGVWGHQALGEVPSDWYDDNGDLKPMHQTADGNLRLPEVFLGHQVVDFLDGMFVGDLQPIGDAVLVDDAEDDTVRMALGVLEWPLGDVDGAKAAFDQLKDAPAPRAAQPTDDDMPLTVSFFSIVVKRSAVVRSYPGGEGEFRRRHSPARQNANLFLFVRMSHGDTEAVLGQLNDAGLIPGQDVAVGDMMSGPLLECPGVTFLEVDDGLLSAWRVDAVAIDRLVET